MPRSSKSAGFLHRTDQQFHFFNEGYGSYDDFLDTLASRKRKALKKERREALADGISIDWLTGSDLTEGAWDAFFAFYMDTGGRKWGRPYLNRKFFSLIGERMADDVLLVMAKRNGRHIAGAINFIGSDALYGRNWGCIEDHPFLHFEVCYHQAIDFAIAKGLKVVEAGAQGEHKLARGYMPVTMQSAHYIAHPGLRRAIADYLKRERREVARCANIWKSMGRSGASERQDEQRIGRDSRAWQSAATAARATTALPTPYSPIEADMTASAYDAGNVFAKILRGELPSHKLYEDDATIAIMDVMPTADGHTLVIPKAPARNMLDADPENLKRLIMTVQKLAQAVKAAFRADGVAVYQFNEAASGQSVFHLHFHIVPRFEGVPVKPHGSKMEDPAVLAANAEKIKAALKN